MAVASPRASARSFRVAPPAFYGDVDRAIEEAMPDPVRRRPLLDLVWQIIEWIRLLAEVVSGVMIGKLNNTDQVTLTANVATTTVTDSRIGTDTQLKLSALTANAAAEVATLYQTLPNVTKEQAVLNHANNAQADRTFGVAFFG